MTVGDLRKVLDHFTDDSPVVYAWTWRSPETVALGRYCGVPTGVESLILDGTLAYGNIEIWKKPVEAIL